MKKVGLLGSGRLGAIIAKGIQENKIPGYQIVGVMGRGSGKADTLAKASGCASCASIEELIALRPDYVVEAATPEALTRHAIPIMAGGAGIIALSIGAFADSAFCAKAREAAEKFDKHIYLASGVIGGFDIMRTAKLMGRLEASLTKRKPARDPSAGEPAPGEIGNSFAGSAAEAIRLYPTHLNIGVAVGLAAGGVDTTRVIVQPLDPGERMNFTTRLSGDFGKAVIYTELGTPEHEPDGPEMAAWSALAVLERLSSRISF